MDRNRFYMLLGDLGILFVALIWGTTNVVIRDALVGITPLWFCGLRFAIAWATVMIFFGHKAFLLPKDTRIKSTLVGMVFICAYLSGAMQAQDAAQPSTPVLGTPFWHHAQSQ